MKVLIVEDDPVQGEVLIRNVNLILGDKTRVVGPFTHYREAVSRIKGEQFDLALLDLELQEDKYAGIHIGDSIRLFNKTPILFVTGIQDEKVLRETDDIDYCHFIQKPYDTETLRRGIGQLINLNILDDRSNHPKVFYKAGFRDKYWIKEGKNKFTCIDIKDLVYVEALDHYCRFHIIGRKSITIKARLRSDIYENSLMMYENFHQLGRSIIININELVSIEGNRILFDDPSFKPIVIPKNGKRQLYELLKIDSSL